MAAAAQRPYVIPPMRRRKLSIASFVIAGLLVAPAIWLYRQLRSHESSAAADVRWTVGGQPGIVRVTVRDAAGKLVAGADVHASNESGGSGGTTDGRGVAEIEVAESEFTGLSLDRKPIVVRSHAYLLGSPNVKGGLLIDVVKKQ